MPYLVVVVAVAPFLVGGGCPCLLFSWIHHGGRREVVAGLALCASSGVALAPSIVGGGRSCTFVVGGCLPLSPFLGGRGKDRCSFFVGGGCPCFLYCW